MNDLKEAMFKYASNKGYWRPEIKLSFNLATTTAMLKRDSFYNTYIVFRPSGWVDNNGSGALLRIGK